MIDPPTDETDLGLGLPLTVAYSRLCAEVKQLADELASERAKVERVRELHRSGPFETCIVCATWEAWRSGQSDLLGMPYPCPTIRALDGDDQADHECRCEVCIGEDGDA